VSALKSSVVDKIATSHYERIIVLSPHLDDAVLSCGGLLLQLRDQLPILVATAATADCPPALLAGHPSLQRLLDKWRPPAQRREEDAAALTLLKVNFVHLGFFDAIFRTDSEQRLLYQKVEEITSAPAESDAGHIEGLRQAVAALLQSGKRLLVLAPLGLGHHVDHQIMGHIARDLKQTLAFDLLYYEDFPYTLLTQHTQLVLEGRADRSEEAVGRLGASIAATYEQPYNIDDKLKVMGCYASQLDAIFGSFEALAGIMKKSAAQGTAEAGERYFELQF
jgi:LmbE family N-acetylglucosaminyl deacetylase